MIISFLGSYKRSLASSVSIVTFVSFLTLLSIVFPFLPEAFTEFLSGFLSRRSSIRTVHVAMNSTLDSPSVSNAL